MKEYPKIQSVFKRDEKTHKFIMDQWSLPEFEYLQNNLWVCTEKVDGTNIRIMWDNIGGRKFGGKTDNAQIPVFLYEKLEHLFTDEKLRTVFPDHPVCLYGEGYGARIQKGGGNYIPDGVDFVLFDVWIDRWWLKREDVEDVAEKLGIEVVPVIHEGSITEAVQLVKSGQLSSRWGCFQAEGLVCKPRIELFARNSRRIITKIKTKDFNKKGE